MEERGITGEMGDSTERVYGHAARFRVQALVGCRF